MGYLIFSATTSIAALILLMYPVLVSLKIEQPLNLLVQYPALTYFTFFIMGILLAPILFLSTIIPNLNETFKNSLLESVRD